MKKFKFGPLAIDPAEYGSQGNAMLGIRGSGKSYGAIEMGEKLHDNGVPWFAFDPTGVWPFIRVPGLGKGYPVVVAGGKHGDLPLTVAGTAALVRAAMESGVSVVFDLHGANLSKADWRRVVTTAVRTLLQENAEHGLRHIFIEEAAEFVPQRPIDWDVYAEIERLARIGGNSRLGYTLINQRSQEVNKAVLELCENIFLYRQRGKNAIENLEKWLDVTGAEERQAIVKSMPDLPTGQCWAWLGGDEPQPPRLIVVPPKNSFHPDRRVMRGDAIKTKAKPVDVGTFVEGMKGQLEQIVAEAKANDPATLKAEIRRLTAELAKKPAATVDAVAIDAAQQAGYQDGYRTGRMHALGRAQSDLDTLVEKARAIDGPYADLVNTLRDALTNNAKARDELFTPATGGTGERFYREAPACPPASNTAAKGPGSRPQAASPHRPSTGGAGGAVAEGLSKPQQRILDALAWLEWVGSTGVDRVRVAMLADQSPKSSGFRANLSTLSGRELLTYRGGEGIELTDAGRGLANKPAGNPTNAELHDAIRSKVSGPQWAMLAVLIRQYPEAVTREEVALHSNQSISSSGFRANLSTLSGLGFVKYMPDAMVRATDILFVER